MRILLILVVLSLFSCKNENEKSATNQSEFTDLQFKLDSLYNAHFNENSPGAALLILYEGEKIVNKGYGLRDLENKEPITPSTNMRSGSITKQFTCLGILNLIQQGKLSLNDTIYKYYPYPIFKNVTIKQFISHTSGIEDPDWIFHEGGWNSSDYVQNEDILNWYAENEIIRFPPGTKFEYNNATYQTLSLIIEKVSGMTYESYIDKYVFNESGMINTQFIDNADSTNIPEYAYRYQKDSLGHWNSVEGHFLDEVVGAGGMYFSLNDFAKYIKSLRDKTILNKESHELIFKPISMNTELHSEDFKMFIGKESSYAMGWEVTDSLALSAGLWNAVNNYVILERKRPLTIVMLSNNDDFFKHRLVDKTYSIVNDYFNKAANTVYN